MTPLFLRSLLERAVKTFAQTLLALLAADAVNVLEVPWSAVLPVALGAAMISVLTSVASAPFGDSASPSLVPGEKR